MLKVVTKNKFNAKEDETHTPFEYFQLLGLTSRKNVPFLPVEIKSIIKHYSDTWDHKAIVINEEIDAITISDDGTLMAISYSCGIIRLWDMQDHLLYGVLNGHRFSRAIFSGDKTKLAFLSHEEANTRGMMLWDMERLTCKKAEIEFLDDKPPLSMRLSRTGDLLICMRRHLNKVGFDHTGIINGALGGGSLPVPIEQAFPEPDFMIGCLCASRQTNTLLAVSSQKSSDVVVMNCMTNLGVKMTPTFLERDCVMAMKFSDNDKYLAIKTGKGYCAFIDYMNDTGIIFRTLSQFVDMCMSPNNKWLAEISLPNVICVWDIAKREKLKHFLTADCVNPYMKFSPDSTMLIFKSINNRIDIVKI